MVAAVPEIAPYGSWRSPIAPAAVASGGRRLAAPRIADDGAVWWAEGRPAEGGRVVLMRRPRGGEPEEVTPADVNVRTRVHEYGGGAWALADAETAVFVDFADQRLYRQRLGGEPVAIKPAPNAAAGLRYADLHLCPDARTLVCVREVHGEAEAENQIVSVALDGSGDPAVLASGRDFYSFPRVSPDGAWLAWTCWDHPNMPWDGTELWLAPLGSPGDGRLIAGGPAESIFQPEWDPQGRLHFVSDRDGWWNLYRLDGDAVAAITAEQADLGHPQWLFGGSTYAFPGDGSIAFIRTERGEERLALLAPGGARTEDLELPYTSFGFPSLSARGGKLAFAAASPQAETAVVLLDLGSGEPRDRARGQRGAGRPGLRLQPAGDHLPDQRRRRRPRLLLPADERRVRGPGGRTAAADRAEPRRPDLARHSLPRPRVPVLDQPRLRRRRRQLPRQQRLRARVSPAPAGRLGRGRQRRLRRRRAVPGRAAARSTARGWRSAAAAPAATRPSARSSSTTTSPPGPATTASPTPRPWPPTPTSSSRATSTG